MAYEEIGVQNKEIMVNVSYAFQENQTYKDQNGVEKSVITYEEPRWTFKNTSENLEIIKSNDAALYAKIQNYVKEQELPSENLLYFDFGKSLRYDNEYSKETLEDKLDNRFIVRYSHDNDEGNLVNGGDEIILKDKEIVNRLNEMIKDHVQKNIAAYETYEQLQKENSMNEELTGRIEKAREIEKNLQRDEARIAKFFDGIQSSQGSGSEQTFAEMKEWVKEEFPEKNPKKVLVETTSRMIMGAVDFGEMDYDRYDVKTGYGNGAEERFDISDAAATLLMNDEFKDWKEMQDWVSGKAKDRWTEIEETREKEMIMKQDIAEYINAHLPEGIKPLSEQEKEKVQYYATSADDILVLAADGLHEIEKYEPDEYPDGSNLINLADAFDNLSTWASFEKDNKWQDFFNQKAKEIGAIEERELDRYSEIENELYNPSFSQINTAETMQMRNFKENGDIFFRLSLNDNSELKKVFKDYREGDSMYIRAEYPSEKDMKMKLYALRFSPEESIERQNLGLEPKRKNGEEINLLFDHITGDEREKVYSEVEKSLDEYMERSHGGMTIQEAFFTEPKPAKVFHNKEELADFMNEHGRIDENEPKISDETAQSILYYLDYSDYKLYADEKNNIYILDVSEDFSGEGKLVSNEDILEHSLDCSDSAALYSEDRYNEAFTESIKAARTELKEYKNVVEVADEIQNYSPLSDNKVSEEPQPSKQEFDELKKNYDSLLSENNRLTNENIKLTSENNSLKGENKSLTDENARLMEQIENQRKGRQMSGMSR